MGPGWDQLTTPGSAVRHASVAKWPGIAKVYTIFFNPYSANVFILKQLSIACIHYSAIRSMYHMVCNVPLSCKTNRDRNQIGAWLDSDLIVE